MYNYKKNNMLKKLSKIAMLCGMLAISTSLFAQNTDNVYPHYGFWSNWSIGVSVDGVKQNEHPWTWGDGTSVGASLLIEKQLNHVWDFRLSFETPAVYSKGFDRYGLVLAGFKFSINNAIAGYNPERRSNIYLLAGGGLSARRQEVGHGDWMLGAELGLGFSYKCCKHSTLFIEAIIDDHADIPDPRTWFGYTDYRVALGYLFNFGATAADEALIAQRALLTQAKFDELTGENSRLESDLNSAKANAQKLEGQVKQLTNENANLREQALARNQESSEKLNAVIEQLKADQLTYYAMPFSVLFPTDGWKVEGTEMSKVDAIVKILKDNPEVKLTLVGFCDYTGSDAYNMKLSQKRAEEVKRVMVRKGIAEDRLTVDYKGKTVAFGDLQYSINRRVSFYRMIVVE